MQGISGNVSRLTAEVPVLYRVRRPAEGDRRDDRIDPSLDFL
jgi:hypothetical protein